MTESELLEGLKSGDQRVFKFFVDQNKQRVFNLCMGYVGDFESAMDLSQEIFIEVFKSVSNFRGDSKLSTWLFRIATNKSLNYLRANKKFKIFGGSSKNNVLINDQGIDVVDTKSKGILDVFLNQDDKAAIHEALEKLNDNQRTAFILNKYEDMSYKEISEIMEISLAKTESLIHRAKKSLQQNLVDYYKNR